MSLTRPPPAGYKDPSSAAEPSRIITTHIDLDLSIDLQKEVLAGSAILHLSLIDPSLTHLVLDGRDLTISEILCAESHEKLSFNIQKDHSKIGDKITIELPTRQSSKAKVRVNYSSKGCGHPAGGAVDWTPAKNGRPPFMFTQGQAVHARSFIPCQDTPSIKCTYEASIDILPPHQNLVALMSAVFTGKSNGKFMFSQKVAIPSYLIAIAVGNLEDRKISDRCTVWAEPHVVSKAKWEFEEVEKYLQVAEKIAGEYSWGVYDLLVLPSSFPYGGMENPCLTFLTPSLLAGDRTLVNVVAHEIAHSWAGNLVTSRDFRHFWLNEGFTVKLERRILRELFGREREGLDSHGGLQGLNNYISRMGSDHPYTRLVTDLKEGDDPDDSFSTVPYEKGYFFLSYLEYKVEQDSDCSSTYTFDNFMWEFWQRFAHQTVVTSDFVTMFTAKFPTVAQEVDWNTWLYSPGFCPELAPIDKTLVTEAVQLADKWKGELLNAQREENPNEYIFDIFNHEACKIKKWDSKQKQLFYAEMVKRVPREEAGKWWNVSSADTFERLYEVDKERNSELKMQWCLLGLRAHRDNNVAATTEFLKSIGRMKFVRPLFVELAQTYPGKEYAKALFLEIRDDYHDICAKMVAKDLGIE